ncbi:UNVERIFIED_CONTAM: hypothetical protein K2H54_026194 [Gekko kuhli]
MPGPSSASAGGKKVTQAGAKSKHNNSTNPTTRGKASAATPAVDSSTVLMGIAQTLERLSERFDKMEGQSTRAAPERKSRPKRPRSPVESISSSDEDVQNHPKRKRKISRKGKSRSSREHREDSDESSGESASDEDSTHAKGDYWEKGAHIPSLPPWAWKRRGEGAGPGEVWGSELQDASRAIPAFSDAEDPPGIHLPRKIRERILDGYYVDIFSLLKPDNEEVFMGVVISSYPERGWHLVNHMANVLKARTMANESAAIEYDEAFRKRASYSAVARWDLINDKIWLVKAVMLPQRFTALSRIPVLFQCQWKKGSRIG